MHHGHHMNGSPLRPGSSGASILCSLHYKRPSDATISRGSTVSNKSHRQRESEGGRRKETEKGVVGGGRERGGRGREGWRGRKRGRGASIGERGRRAIERKRRGRERGERGGQSREREVGGEKRGGRRGPSKEIESERESVGGGERRGRMKGPIERELELENFILQGL